MGVEQELFRPGLRVSKEQLCQQPTKPCPIWMRFVQAGEITVRNINEFGIFHSLNKIMTCFTGNEASEGYDELIFGEEKDVLFFAVFRVAIIDPENAFNDQSQVVANHMLYIEKITFFDFALFPGRPAISDILFSECCKVGKMRVKYFKIVAHRIVFGLSAMHVSVARYKLSNKCLYNRESDWGSCILNVASTASRRLFVDSTPTEEP